MTRIDEVLKKVEKDIKKRQELAYFLIHIARFKFTLTLIQRISQGKSVRVLDVGCFPYFLGRSLELLGHEIFGISSNHEPIKNKQINVLNIENQKFPYRNNFFDMVLCTEVIEHLSQSPVPALREMKRVVKVGGSLIITTPNSTRSINRFKMLWGRGIAYPVDVLFEKGGKGGNIYHRHNREYTLCETLTLLTKTGWSVLTKGRFISYTPFRRRLVPDPFWLFLLKLGNYFLMKVFPSMRDTLFVVAQK